MTNENALERDEDGWFVSSFTNENGSCVQVKFAGTANILVRDSKDRRSDSPIITIPPRGWPFLLKDITAS